MSSKLSEFLVNKEFREAIKVSKNGALQVSSSTILDTNTAKQHLDALRMLEKEASK